MLVTGYLLVVLFLVCELLVAFGWEKGIPVKDVMALGLAFLAGSLLVRGWPWPPKP